MEDRERTTAMSTDDVRTGQQSPSDSVQTWKLHATFIQANPRPGFNYLDHSGSVINEWADKYNERLVGPEGLRLTDPKEPDIPAHIQVGPKVINLAYDGSSAPRNSIERADPIIRSIAKMLDTRDFERIGLRTQYFVRRPPNDRAVLAVQTKSVGSVLSGYAHDLKRAPYFNSQLVVAKNRFTVAIRVATFRITRPPKNWSDFPGPGLLLDIDVYEPEDDPQTPSVFTPAMLRDELEDEREVTVSFLTELGGALLEGVTW